jgi:hypothetical protein
MSLSHAPSRQPTTDVARNLFVGVVIALFVGFFWVFDDPSGPVRPSGPLALRFQSEIIAAAVAVGGVVDEGSCTMAGNLNLGVTCRIGGVTPEVLAAHLQSQGWRRSNESTPRGFILRRDDQHLSLGFVGHPPELSISILRVRS